MDYREFNDQELLSYISEADTTEHSSEILFQKYKPLISKIARKMIATCPNLGLETKDLIQEGYLGLHQAIDTYDDQKEVLFFTYAKTCIESRMISLVVASRRLKHKFLNESLSFEFDDETKTLEAVLEDNSSNPESYLIEVENTEEMIRQIKDRLTFFEAQVFELKINHFNYKEIADLLGKDPKAIDNAIQRIKTKISSYLEENNKN